MAKAQKTNADKLEKKAEAPKKALAVKGAEADVDVKTAEAELEQDDLAAFKAAKKRLTPIVSNTVMNTKSGLHSTTQLGLTW